jgi:type II secretory pathway component PulF
MAADAAWSAWTLDWFPWARRMTAWSRAAAFAEVAGLLVEHEAPLDEALTLAAATAGDATLSRAAADLTAAIREGRPTTTAGHGMPPLLAWLLGSATQRGQLPRALSHAAESYRRRAVHQAELARILAPAVFTVVIGGSAALAYALTVFVPWVTLLKQIS